MSGLESIIATGEDVLAGPLDFDIGSDQASYIVSREQQTFYSSQNILNPTSVKTLKYSLGGNGFLDLSTLHFTFLLKNLSPTLELQPLTCEAHCCFRRFIVRISGTLCENQEFFSKNEEFVRRILPAEKRKDLASMFLGVASYGGHGHDMIPNSIPANAVGAGTTSSKRVVFRPLTSAILNMKKYLPALLLSQGITIELELDNVENSFASANDAGSVSYSQLYSLEDCRCLCDQVTLTSELTDQYTSLLLSGKSLYIDLPDLSETTVQYLPGNEGRFSINSARQYSRLNTLIVSFSQTPLANGRDTKEVNNFYIPATSVDTIESNLVINGNRMPACNNLGVCQHWNRLLRGVGAYGGIGTSTSISYTGFGGGVTNVAAGGGTLGRSFAVIFDLEKMPAHSSTGEPMASGGYLTVNISGLGTITDAYATKVYITAHHSGALEIRDSGCQIYS